jgi:phosphoglycerate dehydrogenase-like enzyme
VILTPHAAFFSVESTRAPARAAQNIVTWLATGRPITSSLPAPPPVTVVALH